MRQEEKDKYQQRYAALKQKGGKFYPDVVFKDLLVSFAIFLLLIGLASFVGVAPEPPADPSDTAYIPRPEWYFLFLFEFLKFIPGNLEWIGTFVVPTAAVLLLLLLPFIDRNPSRHWKKRRTELLCAGLIVAAIVGLTVRAVITTPAQPETNLAGTLPEKIAQGQDLFSINCAECHGADGEGGEIVGVAGLEGTLVKAIHSQDEMFTRTDETLHNVIDYGQPNLKMPPFGKGYGGPLAPAEIANLVTFMRYTWDERSELPAEAAAAGSIPELKAGDIAAYDTHIAPLVKRYCVTCHRSGKNNQNYLMQTYQEILTSGDHAPNLRPGDMQSNLLRMLHREEIEAGGPMPPTKPLADEYIRLFENWTQNGLAETSSTVPGNSKNTATPVAPQP